MKKFCFLLIAIIALFSCSKDGSSDYLSATIPSSWETRSVSDSIFNSEHFVNPLSSSYTLPNGLIVFKEGNHYRLDDMLFPNPSNNGNASIQGVITSSDTRYWPSGIIPFKFSSDCNPLYQSTALSAMSELSDSTGVQFVLANSTTPNYIMFKTGFRNRSYVGMLGGEQEIELALFGQKYVVMHEIMHALGVYHEHQRADRDSYIEVQYDNLYHSSWNNFAKQTTNSYDLGDFNFESIMLYASRSTDRDVVIDITEPIMLKTDGTEFPANRQYLSQGDIQAVRTIYGNPYVDLDTEIEIIRDEITATDEYYIADYEWYIRFYQDSAHTVPIINVRPLQVTLKKEIRTLGNHGDVVSTYSYQTITIPAGNSSYLLDSHRNIENYYESNATEVDFVLYSLN